MIPENMDHTPTDGPEVEIPRGKKGEFLMGRGAQCHVKNFQDYKLSFMIHTGNYFQLPHNKKSSLPRLRKIIIIIIIYIV